MKKSKTRTKNKRISQMDRELAQGMDTGFDVGFSQGYDAAFFVFNPNPREAGFPIGHADGFLAGHRAGLKAEKLEAKRAMKQAA